MDLSSVFKTFFKSKEKTILEHQEKVTKDRIHTEFKSSLIKFKEVISKDISDSTIVQLQESFCAMIPLFDTYKNDSLFEAESKLALAINDLDKSKLNDQVKTISTLLDDVLKVLKTTDAKMLLESELSAVADEMVEVEQPKEEPEIETVATSFDPPPATPEKSAIEIGFEDGRKYYKEMKEKGLKPNNFSRHLAETNHAQKSYRWVENWLKGFNEGIKFHETVQRDLHPELFEDENEDSSKG